MAFLSNHTYARPWQARQWVGWVLALITGLMQAAQAQNQVHVLINVNPPYSAYLQDYAGAGQQVQIRLINTSGRPLPIRLQGSVTGDNGVSIRTLPNYRPPIPFTLPPGTTLLARKDLEGLFDLNQFTVEGMDKNLLYQGKPLPEGNYQVCVQVFDNRTSQVLSAGEPLGCSPPFPVRAIEPPILIAPLCDGDVLPTIPQATVFTWTPPAGILPTQVSYTLRIIELPLENVDPNVFIDAVALPPSGIEVKNLPTSTFLYGPQYLPLKVGKRYAWRVQAVDKFGRLNLLNDGKSPVCAFRYGPAELPVAAVRPEPQLVFVTPEEAKGKQLPKIPVGVGNLFKMSWKAENAFVSQLLKTLSISKHPTKTLTDQLPDLTYSLRIYDRKGSKLVFSRQMKTEYLEAEKTELPAAFVTGKDYRAEVSLLGLSPVQLKKLGLPEDGRIEAEPRLFTLVAEDKGDPTDSLTVKGTLAFRYPGETGAAHILPNTKVTLQKVFPNKYRGTIAYGETDAQGNYSIRVLRSSVHGNDSTQSQTRCLVEVVNPFIQPLADAGYYQNSEAGTFLINRSQTGSFTVEGVTYLAAGYRLAVTVRQAYKNWPGATDVKLDGKQVVLYRKPGVSNYDKYRLPVEGQVEKSNLGGTANVSVTTQGGPLIAELSTNPQANGTLMQTASPVGQKVVNGTAGNTPANKPGKVSAETANKNEVEKAGYIYIGTATIKADGNAYVAQFDRLTYSVAAYDRYSIYCPDCGQEPQDAESFSFQAPKAKLVPQPAKVESYTFNIQTTEAPTITFTGRLNYKFADSGKQGAQVKPLGNTQVHLQVVYRNANGGTFSATTPNYAEFTDFHQGFSTTLDTKVTTADGSFSFSVKMTKPLKLGAQPATQETGSGEFKNPSAVFIRALRVVVDNPYYASPVETYGDDATEQLKPLETYDLGPVTALVRSYSLNVQIKSDTTGLSKVLVQQAGIRQELSGVKVSVLRYPKSTFPGGPNLLPPVDEETGIKTTQKFNGINYTVIATDKSNADGIVSFPRMVMANGKEDAYFIATESSVDGLNNYTLVSLKRITVNEGWGAAYTATPTDAEKKQAEKLGKVIKGGADVNCKTVWYVRHQEVGGSYTKLGPYYLTNPEHAKLIASYKELSAKDPSYDVYPYDLCDKADTYWIGDKLHDSPINNKVLIDRNVSTGVVSPEFADQYKPFTSDVVQRFLAPGQPVVNVRVVDKTNPTQGVKGAAVRLTYIDTKGNAQAAIKYTGENGWIAAPFVTTPGTNAILSIKADGYIFNGYATADQDDAPVTTVNEQKVTIGTLLLGQNAYYPRMLMQPNTRIVGWTVDTDSTIANGAAKPSVEAYVQVDDGFYNKTWWSSTKKAYRFAAYAPSGKADSLKIYPTNISYFNEYRLVKNLPKPVPSDVAGEKGISIINAGEVPIYQRDHRIDFILVDKLGKKPVQGGMVKLFGRNDPKSTFGPSDNQGIVSTQFKNVSVENLFVEVSAPGYVTKTQSVTNTESKSSKIQLVFMEAANLIKGVVVVKTADGKEKPLPGAEVFAVGGSNAQTPYSTTAGPGGVFTLAVGKQFSDLTIQATYREEAVSGVSGSFNLNGGNNNVTVIMNGGQSYIGATEKNYKLPQAANTSLKLTLTTFDKYKISTIWGFPIKVESFTALANNYVQVSGEVELSNSKFGPFGIIDPDVRVRFEKVLFKPGTADPTQGEPVNAKIKLNVGILDNLGYYDKAYKPGQTPLYNVRLTALDGGPSGGNFQIERREGSPFGVVYAQAQVIDNSFKFSENLFSYEKGQFFLYDPKQDGQPGIRPFVVAFDSDGSGIKRTNFGLCRKDGKPMTVKLLAFDATSSLEGSRLVGDEIQLNPTLKCMIKDAQPASISVTIGKLVLRNSTVDAKSGDTPLTFALAGSWSVEIRNWSLDYKKGGFYSTEGVVKTGKVDVPISLFNLRADFLKIEAAPTSKLSLAGLTDLAVNGQAFFGYDAATGSDMKGHWSVVVVPSGKGGSAAKLGPNSGLPGLDKGLDFETISLLDNGEDVLTFGAGSKSVDFFGGVVQVRPKTIETGKDYFAFDAGMSTKIPNAPKDVQMRFTYSRPAGQQKVALKTTIPAEYVIDTKGQIAFTAGDEVSKDGGQKKAFYFANGVMAIRGMAEEPGKLKLGDPSHNAMLLVHSVKNGFTHITHDRDLDLNNESVLLSLTNKLLEEDTWKAKPLAIDMGDKTFQSMYCHQRVNGTQWELLKFSGIPGGFDGLDPTEQNRIAFTAYGEIKAENQKFKPKGIDSGNGKVGKDGDKIGASGVGTPFGNLELVYDMSEKRFTGTLQVPGLAIGEEGMSAMGTAQVRFDPKGFYFVLGGMVKDVPIIVPVDLKGGVMVGWYASDDIGEAKEILFAYSHRKALPCAFKAGFKGFFCIGEVPIPVIGSYKSELEVPGVGGYKVAMDAYVDGYLFGNYDGGVLTWGSGLGVSSHAYAYGKVLVVSASGETYMSGSADANMTLQSGQVAIDLTMNMSAGFAVSLTVDPPGTMLDATVPVSADFCLTLKGHAAYKRGDGFSLKPDVDCKFEKCPSGCIVAENP
ncbi:hypothetical protein ACFSUS_15370 [Spirosoma soli]|uniref:T9SS type A sorting domain-containing protein n=1 Tax=Spirosoma soli TaxID=1770529 RepID=A0ABW5M771_9BACT